MERRLDHRYPVESLEARIEPIPGLPAIAARVRNISAGGAQLLADRPLNIGIMILSFVLFSGIAYILDPLFHNVGYAVLKSEALTGFWTNVFSCPIALLANLNNSIVLGSLIVSIPLTLPLFFFFNQVVVKYREKIQVAMEKFPIFRSLKIIKVYQTLMGERG